MVWWVLVALVVDSWVVPVVELVFLVFWDENTSTHEHERVFLLWLLERLDPSTWTKDSGDILRPWFS